MGLWLLGAISIAFGAVQLSIMATGEGAQVGNGAYLSMPLPIWAHIIFGTLFNVLVPLQFAPTLRSRFRAWHRWQGRALALCTIVISLSALWMNHFYPSYGGVAKYSGIMVHGVILVGACALGIWAIKQRNINRHRAWMMRATAVALSPSTQRMVILPLYFATGEMTDLMIGGAIWCGMLVNLAVVEWILWRERLSYAAK